MCEHKNTTIIDDKKYCADCGQETQECPVCGKEPLACQCPTINRGSFAVDKREEIREGIARWLFRFTRERENLELNWEQTKGYYLQEADYLMGYLNSQDVVIRAKCPDCAWGQVQEAVGMTPCYSCNSTGYITEPIIGEGNE